MLDTAISCGICLVMRKIMTNDKTPCEKLVQMLGGNKQVWVRCPSKIIGGGERHWSRARLLNVIKDEATIKPIKHGGRIERVPLSVLRLWKSMNAKQ